MKKLKKLSVLVLLAAGFALAFSGCSNTKDETGTEQGGEAGSGGETGGTGGSNDDTENPGDSGSSGDNTGSNGDATGSGGNNSSGGQTGGDSTGSGGDNSNGGQTGGDENGAKGKVIKGIGVGGDEGFTFADLEITENYSNSSLIKKNSDGTLTVTAGNWDQFNIPLPTAINISGKKIAITAKVASDYEQGSGLFKLIFAESDDKQSEITANKAADGGKNEGWCDPLTTEFKTYTGPDIWIAYEKEEKADLTKITKIIINPQSGKGDITIQSIEFVD